MRTLGNILWHFPFFGFVNAIIVYFFGLLLTITVVAAPIGSGADGVRQALLFSQPGHGQQVSTEHEAEQGVEGVLHGRHDPLHPLGCPAVRGDASSRSPVCSSRLSHSSPWCWRSRSGPTQPGQQEGPPPSATSWSGGARTLPSPHTSSL
ncbi:MAG: YccF domain-containing protein [Phycisphaeraceae bacterium]|nr:YccF domain-containing protein [Phycisphaeraceae bacterium]